MPDRPVGDPAPPAARARKERKDNADMRRRQLLDAALVSVAKYGLARTTLATVAAEAGLSQGVAVFYFKSKNGLLVAALRAQYELYRKTWQDALEAAPDDPLSQIVAMVRADFSSHLCGEDAIAVWFAFWGEAAAQPLFSEICEEAERSRYAAMEAACRRLVEAVRGETEGGETEGGETGRGPDPALLAASLDAMTDGLWLQLHIYGRHLRREDALEMALNHLGCLMPAVAERVGAGPRPGPGPDRLRSRP